MAGLEGIYRSGESLKRREEVLERLRAGRSTEQIATDLGIEAYSVAEIAERLRQEGAIPAGADTAPSANLGSPPADPGAAGSASVASPAGADRGSGALVVGDAGQEIAFDFADMLRYAGPASPGGVAHAFKVMQRALPLLAAEGVAPERREIAIRTAFGGPGARDGFECVTRAVSGERYLVEPELERPELGTAARFVFRLSYGDRVATLTLREGFVTREFLDLAGADERTDAEEAHLTELKRELADRVMWAAAAEVYDATVESAARRAAISSS